MQRPWGTSGLVSLSQGPCENDDFRTKTHETRVKKEEVGCEHYFTTQHLRTKPSTPGQQPGGRSRVALPGEAVKETGQGGHSWGGRRPTARTLLSSEMGSETAMCPAPGRLSQKTCFLTVRIKNSYNRHQTPRQECEGEKMILQRER